MRPPLQITSKLLRLVSEISQLIGRCEGLRLVQPQMRLRKHNRARSIHGSLAIEGNTLTLEQVTAVLEGQMVLAVPREVQEVRNAEQAYARVQEWCPHSQRDLLRAHRSLMHGLVDDAGQWRKRGVGILQGTRVAHVAPPAQRVPFLMSDLCDWLRTEKEWSPLLTACVVHYEIEFIHPFSDGNGRIGRLWQSVILSRYHPIFEFLPVELAIQQQQTIYYRTLAAADRTGNAAPFVEFALTHVHQTLAELLSQASPQPDSVHARLERMHAQVGKRDFSRKEYLLLIKTIGPATASRDLAHGVSERILKATGDKATARYRFR